MPILLELGVGITHNQIILEWFYNFYAEWFVGLLYEFIDKFKFSSRILDILFARKVILMYQSFQEDKLSCGRKNFFIGHNSRFYFLRYT